MTRTLRLIIAVAGLALAAVLTACGGSNGQPKADTSMGGLSTTGPTSSPSPAPTVASLSLFTIDAPGSGSSPSCETWPASSGNGIVAQIGLQLADPSSPPVSVHSITVQWQQQDGSVVATTTVPESATVTAGQVSSFNATAPSSVTLDYYGSDNYGCQVSAVS